MRTKAILAALTLVVAGIAVPATAAQAAVPKLRVMPLGDSITWGSGSSNGSGYRGPLWNALTARGYGAGLDFVGSQFGGTMPDPDNEGHPGWWIDTIQGIATQVVSQYRPNVVLLHIGTNDMNGNGDVANAPARLSALIDQILAAAPDATVEVAQIIRSANPDYQARIAAYNAAIPGVVQAKRNAGKHVRLVDMSAVTNADLPDSVHPNDAGYQKMSAAWDAAVQASVADGWIADPVGTGGSGLCTRNVGWSERGQIATGVGSNLAHTQFADINGDKRDDYLVVNDNAVTTEWQNNGGDGAGGWIGKGQIAGGAGTNLAHLRWADINGDLKDDFLVMGDNGSVTEWQNNGGDGSGGWIGKGQIATGTGADLAHVRFADFTGDGKDDYLVLGDNGSVTAWVNTGSGWSGVGKVAGGATDLAHVRFADLNGDGKDDYLVMGDNGSITLWQNNGGDIGGGWIAKGQVASGTGADLSHVRFADVNGDGRDDYLVVGDNGSVKAWMNTCT